MRLCVKLGKIFKPFKLDICKKIGIDKVVIGVIQGSIFYKLHIDENE